MEDVELLREWLDNLAKFKLPEYENLPNLGLYMDQVTHYVNSLLNPIIHDDSRLTSSMVNNYVKQNIVPAPINKKYGRGHLVHLIGICVVKQVLAMSNLKILVDTYEEFDEEKVYKLLGHSLYQEINSLINTYRRKLSALERIKPSEEEKKTYLLGFAVKLSIEAELKKIVAEKIVDVVTCQKTTELNKKNKTKKAVVK